MKSFVPQINLVFAWMWIFAGFLSGMVMGFFFDQETWLGGYTSHKRRMYRLGHISFFGLGAVNFIFYLTARAIGDNGSLDALWEFASALFIVGGVTMPLCCVLMAHETRLRPLFGIPVLSLISAAVLTIITILL
ncbi:MAG TPA: hypothetical protein VGR78_08125 [Verrucomicrobiae bacterium]|nr:hypothetical protein [Verrucomicrobiae bacterium]